MNWLSLPGRVLIILLQLAAIGLTLDGARPSWLGDIFQNAVIIMLCLPPLRGRS